MSIASVIARNGKLIQWTSMAGQGQVYDTTTGTMVGGPPVTKNIWALLDGFGSVESQLRFDQFLPDTLIENGGTRVFCVERIRTGDSFLIDGVGYTAAYVKSVWKKSKVVLYEGLVRQ